MYYRVRQRQEAGLNRGRGRSSSVAFSWKNTVMFAPNGTPQYFSNNTMTATIMNDPSLASTPNVTSRRYQFKTPSSLPITAQYLVSSGALATAGGVNIVYANTGTLQIVYNTATGRYVVSLVNMQLDTLFNLALTFDGATLRVYNYGILVGLVSTPIAITGAAGSTFAIGAPVASLGTPEFNWRGKIYTVACWNGLKTPYEMDDISNNQPVYGYIYNENAGATTLTDAGTGGKNLTATGGASVVAATY